MSHKVLISCSLSLLWSWLDLAEVEFVLQVDLVEVMLVLQAGEECPDVLV